MIFKKPLNARAFTITEFLITIILLTLIILGIFFIKKTLTQSSVKSLIVQIERYNFAINSFTQKYHALPGDVEDTVAYGITTKNTDGNGDNLINDRNGEIKKANGEISNFWLHLSKSKMLNEDYDGKSGRRAKVGSTFPLSKVGQKVGIVAFSARGKSYFQVGLKNSSRYSMNMTNYSLKPGEAFLLDEKIDDGDAKRGKVFAAGGSLPNILKNNECLKFKEYNLSNSKPSCQLRIEME